MNPYDTHPDPTDCLELWDDEGEDIDQLLREANASRRESDEWGQP